MKIVGNDTIFHSRGVQNSNEYTVANNAKMMKLLSDNVYKDKIRAVIRELSTNARDSHIAAKQTRPFEVHLPTWGNLVFRIRDFGTGMSQEKLETMYRTYGASDKNDSNDYNGCMGIGSKSPFAYAKTFTCISYYNGKKFTYVNAKNELGVPSINCLSVENTTEPNGLEIQVPVNSNDYATFQQKAIIVYRPFPKSERPIVYNGTNVVSIYEYKQQFSGKNWFIDNSMRKAHVIMGCVEYPIDVEHFEDKTAGNVGDGPSWARRSNASPTMNKYSTLLNSGVCLHMNIGDVEMDVGREGLQYTADTVKNIKAALDSFLTELTKQVHDKYISLTRMWDVRVHHYNLLNGELSSLSQLLQVANLTWKGQKITTRVDVDYTMFSSGFNINYVYAHRNTIRETSKVNHFDASWQEPVFLIDDLPRGMKSAARRYIDSLTSGRRVYVVSSADLTNDVKLLQQVFDMDPASFILASSLPKPPKVKRGPIQRVFELNMTNGSTYGASAWTACEVDPEDDDNDGDVFVEMRNWAPIGAEGSLHSVRAIHSCVAILARLGIKIGKIYGVKTSGLSKFSDDKSVIKPLHNFVVEALDKYATSAKIDESAAKLTKYNELCGSCPIDKIAMIMKAYVNPPATSVLADFHKKFKDLQIEVKAFTKQVEEFNTVCSMVGYVNKNKSAPNPVLDAIKYDSVSDKYPMLQFVEYYELNKKDALTTVVQYVTGVDNL